MCTGLEVAAIIAATATAASVSKSIHDSVNQDEPKMPDAGAAAGGVSSSTDELLKKTAPPPEATQAEQAAQTQAKQVQAQKRKDIMGLGGRGSTILTGGGLGELGTGQGQAKTLLGS